MNIRKASSFPLSAALGLAMGLSLTVLGADPAGSAPAPKMPELKKDYSAVSDGRS